jgi:hypothetical protein
MKKKKKRATVETTCRQVSLEILCTAGSAKQQIINSGNEEVQRWKGKNNSKRTMLLLTMKRKAQVGYMGCPQLPLQSE